MSHSKGVARGRRDRKPPPLLTALQQAKLAGALAAHQRGDVAMAVQAYREVLAAVPRCHDALHYLGVALIQQGACAEGVKRIELSLDVLPEQPHAESNLSTGLLELGRATEALAAADRAVGKLSGLAAAWYNRGNALRALSRLGEAIGSYRRALELQPHYPDCLNNLGSSLRESHQHEAALAAFDAAISQNPGHASAHNNRGLALLDLNRPREAIESYQHALALNPDFPAALNNLGNILMQERRPADALVAFERLASVAPDYMYVRGNVLHARLNCCDWRDYDKLTDAIVAGVRTSGGIDFPFSFLCVSGAASLQLACATAYTADQYPPVTTQTVPAARQGDRLRIGYVSGDFGDHPVSYLMAGILEAHDRARVEVIGLSWGRRGEGAMRTRMERACDQFIDITALDDEGVVDAMRALGIDVAVDLTGHTRGNRTGIFARRAAPAQVNFLGLPATMGAPYMDYLIADRFLVPEHQQQHYAEKIVWLPDCFQPNDGRRQIGPAPQRADLGLPAGGIVLCSFNNPCKLTPAVFSVWMRLLRAAPSAVLWLFSSTASVSDNLRSAAAEHGIDPNRLVFAPRVDYPTHMARLQQADLFLDTAPFNAGATASDALSAGVPVLTVAGESFSSRMAGSLVTCLGFPELVTESLEGYEQRALDLVRKPSELSVFREALITRRESHRFFDSIRYCRHLEAAYVAMRAALERGDAPRSISVDTIA